MTTLYMHCERKKLKDSIRRGLTNFWYSWALTELLKKTFALCLLLDSFTIMRSPNKRDLAYATEININYRY